MLLKFVDHVLLAFQEAVVKSEVKTYYYDIAGHTLRLDFAGSSLVPFLTPAFEHLSTASCQDAELTVHIWDSASIGVDIPPFPWKDNSDVEHFPSSGERSLLNPVVFFKDKGIQGTYNVKSSALNIFDHQNQRAFFWVPDADRVSYGDSSAPLLTILQWWMRSYGLQIVHSAAVGFQDGGALLAGKGGSGKSCTALACLMAGMGSPGDDFVLVDSFSAPRVFSLYNSSKIYPSDLHRFSGFIKTASSDPPPGEDKVLVFLHTVLPQRIIKRMIIRAILFPHVNPADKTGLKPISPAFGLKSLAPSSIFILRGAGQDDLRRMAQLVFQIPGYILNLGQDSHRAPELIRSLLSDLSAVNQNLEVD